MEFLVSSGTSAWSHPTTLKQAISDARSLFMSGSRALVYQNDRLIGQYDRFGWNPSEG